MFVCEKCGKEFTPKDQTPSHLERNPPRYCSKECGQTNRSNGALVSCTHCHKPLYRRKSYLAQTRLPFCDHKCYGKWQKLHYRQSSYDLKEYKYQRRIALDRDDYTCQDCGITIYETRLNAHHIVERGPDQPPNHDASNLVTLCD